MSDHTAFMRDANARRLSAFRECSDLFKGVRWLGTLDSSACIVCAAMDGLEWDFDGGPMRGHTVKFRLPPLHDECRCILTGVRLHEGGMNRRASQVGQLSGDTSFTAFLKKLPPATADEILGRERANLFRAGTLDLRDMISETAQLLTLDELTRLMETRTR